MNSHCGWFLDPQKRCPASHAGHVGPTGLLRFGGLRDESCLGNCIATNLPGTVTPNGGSPRWRFEPKLPSYKANL